MNICNYFEAVTSCHMKTRVVDLMYRNCRKIL